MEEHTATKAWSLESVFLQAKETRKNRKAWNEMRKVIEECPSPAAAAMDAPCLEEKLK